VTVWWELPGQARYLREHLIEHMLGAGRAGQAEETAADLRWVDARLRASGPAAAAADLALAGTPRAERLRRVLAQSAHLLAPTDPPHSQTDILYSRVSHDPDWGPQAQALSASRQLPALSSKWPQPDLPGPRLRRTFTGHTGTVTAVAIASGGSWVATAGEDGTARIWDAATGQHRATLTGHASWVNAVAIAPDGGWLATGSRDGTARIWDADTGHHRATLGKPAPTVANAPDRFSWLGTDWETVVAIAPDGTWLATGYLGGVRIWDAATGQQRATLPGNTDLVKVIAIAPDGTWLAAGNPNGMVRIWDAAPGSTAPRSMSRCQPSRSRPTGPGLRPPAAAGCGSGTPPPGSTAPPSQATPAG
jgi:WD40 repeat protein